MENNHLHNIKIFFIKIYTTIYLYNLKFSLDFLPILFYGYSLLYGMN